MIGVGFMRRMRGGSHGAPPSGPFYTVNSAIYHDITNIFTQVFVTAIGSGSRGTVDTTKTAPMTADAGGLGVHAFNPDNSSGVRWRANSFVVQPGTTSVVYSIELQNHPGDSGKKVALAVYTTPRAVVSSTGTSPIHVVVPKHGRETGDTVTIADHYNEAFAGLSAANGTWTVVKVDDDTLELTGSTSSTAGMYTGHLTGSSIRTSVAVTLTGSMTAATLTMSSPPIGAEFEARLSNDPDLGADADTRAYVGTQTLTCVGATGLFADYVRLQWMPSHWQYNLETFEYNGGYWAFADNRGQEASTHAYLEADTDASELVVETCSTMYGGYKSTGYTIAASTGTTVKVNNSDYVDVKGTRDTSSELLTIPLPGILANIKMYNVGRNNIASGWVGSLYRAIYIPRNKAFTLRTQPTPKSRVIVTVGDSITSGFAAQPLVQYAWASQLRGLLNCDVFDDGTGGIIAYQFSGASCQERADKVQTVNPTDITLALGTNDYQQENGGFQSLANYLLYMAALVDAFLATSPTAKLHLLFIWNKTSIELNLNNQNHLVEDFRKALIAIAVARRAESRLRPIWVKDWTVYSGPGDDYRAQPAGMLDELVHPNNSGHTKIAARLAAVIPATRLTFTPSSATVAPNGSRAFSAAGGSGTGYVYSLSTNASGGSVNSSGVYTAGSTPGTDILQVMDSHGQMNWAVITVE